jgi:hypothetical protein
MCSRDKKILVIGQSMIIHVCKTRHKIRIDHPCKNTSGLVTAHKIKSLRRGRAGCNMASPWHETISNRPQSVKACIEPKFRPQC